MRYLSAIGLIGLVVAGCQQANQNSMGARSQLTPQQNAAAHDDTKFDLAKEPAFTAQTYLAAGQLGESQGNFAHAIDQYKEGIKLEPKNQMLLYRLAVLLTQQHEFDQAEPAWKDYVAATNNNATAYSNLAYCYDMAGNTAEAEGAYRLGISHDPNNQQCRLNLGLMLARLNRYDEAVEQLTVVLSPAEAHYDLGSLYEGLGKKEQARSEFHKSLVSDPKMWEAKARLAEVDTSEETR